MDLTGSLSLISFSLSAFLAGLLWFDGERRPETRVLAALLGLHALAFLLRYGFTGGSPLIVIYLPFVVFPLLALHGPLVEYFTRSSLFDEKLTGGRRLAFVLIPTAILLVYGALFALIPAFRDQRAILSQAPPVGLFSRLLLLSYNLFSLIFLVRAFQALRTYQARFQERYSNIDGLRLQFLRSFLTFIGVVYLTYVLLTLVSFLFSWSFPVTPLEGLLLLGLTYLVLYYLIRRPQIFTVPSGALDSSENARAESTTEAEQTPATDARTAPAPSAANPAPKKYARQSLDDATRRDYLQRIQAYMESERPYLDEELGLADLARAVQVPEHHLSMVINIELDQNFFQFVNAYRVDEARRLLADPELAGDTLLSIAYRAGFQSKAAFNKVFKKFTDQTPGQYRTQAASN